MGTATWPLNNYGTALLILITPKKTGILFSAALLQQEEKGDIQIQQLVIRTKEKSDPFVAWVGIKWGGDTSEEEFEFCLHRRIGKHCSTRHSPSWLHFIISSALLGNFSLFISTYISLLPPSSHAGFEFVLLHVWLCLCLWGGFVHHTPIQNALTPHLLTFRFFYVSNNWK